MELLVVSALVLWTLGVFVVVTLCRAAAVGDRAVATSRSAVDQVARLPRAPMADAFVARRGCARTRKPVI